jgi:hypothetical protein
MSMRELVTKIGVQSNGRSSHSASDQEKQRKLLVIACADVLRSVTHLYAHTHQD